MRSQFWVTSHSHFKLPLSSRFHLFFRTNKRCSRPLERSFEFCKRHFLVAKRTNGCEIRWLCWRVFRGWNRFFTWFKQSIHFADPPLSIATFSCPAQLPWKSQFYSWHEQIGSFRRQIRHFCIHLIMKVLTQGQLFYGLVSSHLVSIDDWLKF